MEFQSLSKSNAGGARKWSTGKVPASLPFMTTFTKPSGESFSYSQQQVTSGVRQDCHETITTANTSEDDEDVESLLDKVLTHKQLQEARQVEKHLLHYIFNLHGKVKKLTKDNKELKESSQNLVIQAQDLRTKLDVMTFDNKRYKSKASVCHSKLKECLLKLDKAEERAIVEGKKRKAAEQQCAALKEQLAQQNCNICRNRESDKSCSVVVTRDRSQVERTRALDERSWSPKWEEFKDEVFPSLTDTNVDGSETVPLKSLVSSATSHMSKVSRSSSQGAVSLPSPKIYKPTCTRSYSEKFPTSCHTLSKLVRLTLHEKIVHESACRSSKEKGGIMFMVQDASPEKPCLKNKHNTQVLASTTKVCASNNHCENSKGSVRRSNSSGNIADNLLSRTCCYAPQSEIAAVTGKSSKYSEKRQKVAIKKRSGSFYVPQNLDITSHGDAERDPISFLFQGSVE